MDIRNIEKAWRVGWMRAIGRALPGERITSLPDPTRGSLKVLFVRYERIGDMIMSTGMIRVLATAHPNITLDVLANPTTAPVLEHNPYIRKVFTLDRRSWKSYRDTGRALRAERYDVIVDGRINNPPVFTSTPLLMLMARARYRVGVSGGNNDLIYNVRVQSYDRSMHYVEGSKALAQPFGVDVIHADWQPELFLTEYERERANAVWRSAETSVAISVATGEMSHPRLLVNLSASEPKRRWGDENFIAVLQAVRARHPHIPIVVMGLPNEWESVERVAKAVHGYPAATPALRDALALVGTSDRVFTPDTSISHAASAFRKPEVVLLKRDHVPYAPWNTPGDIVLWDGDTIHGLPVDGVRDAVVRLVDNI
jgi:ADP-heptose:LPS heptosyltransferase